ncbi:CTCL tumor antigen se2-1 [Cryptosporidium felis]|nr:CTCL tumor antigen se2-1 [Cryptosporidium felis]
MTDRVAISESFSEIYSIQESANALEYMLESSLETLLNKQEQLRLEEGLSDKKKELKIKQDELERIIKENEESLGKTVENVLLEMRNLSRECGTLEKDFSGKASSIPSIIETMNKSDTEFESEYFGKKVTVEDIQNLQNTRKTLLSDLEKLRSDEEALNKEIQDLELKWNAFRKRTQRLETEISLKKTETGHQASQVDAHINRRLSASSIKPENNPELNKIPPEESNSQEQTGIRRKRRDSVAKWIGRLSVSNSSDGFFEESNGQEALIQKDSESLPNTNEESSVHEKDEEVQGELQVLNLLSLVKIEQSNLEVDRSLQNQGRSKDPKSGPFPTLNLKIDPSPLLAGFLDPDFAYASGLEPLKSASENEPENHQSSKSLFSKGPLDFTLKLRSQSDGSKSFEEVVIAPENLEGKSITAEDVALFNIFVGELKRNENIPVSSVGKLLCSTLK